MKHLLVSLLAAISFAAASQAPSVQGNWQKVPYESSTIKEDWMDESSIEKVTIDGTNIRIGFFAQRYKPGVMTPKGANISISFRMMLYNCVTTSASTIVFSAFEDEGKPPAFSTLDGPLFFANSGIWEAELKMICAVPDSKLKPYFIEEVDDGDRGNILKRTI